MRSWQWRSVVVATVFTAYLFSQSGNAGAPTVAASPPLVVTVPSWLVSATSSTTVPTAPSTTQVRSSSLSPGNKLVVDGAVWDSLAWCESRGNWSANTGNGFGGGLQFAHDASWSTWVSYGGNEFSLHPWEASRDEQIVIGQRVFADVGWRAWPACSRKLGLS